MGMLGHLHAIGLTGGIGSGKSLIDSILTEHGLNVIDADQLARKLHHDPDICTQLVNAFGNDVVDSALKSVIRPALAKAAFANKESLKTLNRIMHPAMKRLIQDEVNNSNDRIVLDAAILFEAGWQELVDATVAVICPLDIRIKRIHVRDGLSQEQIESRILAQMTDLERIAHADYLIYNVGTVELLRRQVNRIFF